MVAKIRLLTGRVTGYHRLAEAALYRRNWDFGNINPEEGKTRGDK